MTFKLSVFAVVCLGGLAAHSLPQKPRVEILEASKEDNVPAETGFANPSAPVHQGSKFFQDIYMAMEKPGELEFGHVRETPSDWEQRFEKLNLGTLGRQGKVRWGDKHGGYGEHYWDYNHAGHGGDDGEESESQQSEEYAGYGEETNPKVDVLRNKREPEPSGDVEFINDKARSLLLDENAQKHGGNYRSANDYRGKREQSEKKLSRNFGESLTFDTDEGVVIDEATGIRYSLNPIR